MMLIVDRATGHCRRRKIRCQLPLPEDVQGRCTNCIRLKKECNFYPVDQAPPTESKPPPHTRRDTAMSGAPSVSTQSSPHISGASQPGSVADEVAHAHLQSPKVEHLRQQREGGGFPVPSSGEGLLSPQKVLTAPVLTQAAGSHSSGPFFAPPPGGGGAPWPEQQPSSTQYPQQHRGSIAESQYWSANNTPTTAHYSHDSALSFNASTPTSYNSPNFGYTQGASQFAPPARAMSFGHIEGMSHHYSYPGVQYGHQVQQPGYTLPSQPQFSHNPFPPHGPGAPQHQSAAAPEEVPRNWSSAPSVQAPMVASHPYQQNLPSSFYSQSHTQDVYDNRAPTGYHGQYYAPASHPG